MKELSIEEKAARYDRSLEKARDVHTYYCDDREQLRKIEHIFPELAESEDERIKKALIEGFKVMNAGSYGECTFSNYNIPVIDIITWLEKQGNLIGVLQEANKKISKLVEENYYLKEEQKGKLVLTPEAYERVLKLGEKQGEQKPAEWRQDNVEELTEFENVMMHIGSSFFGENAGLNPNDTTCIKEQANLLLELVPKQEWSEEDKNMLQSILDEYKSMTIEKRNWLKFLKDRYTWKPSDEQMDALRYVTNFDYGGHKATLVSLYEQLNKLKE